MNHFIYTYSWQLQLKFVTELLLKKEKKVYILLLFYRTSMTDLRLVFDLAVVDCVLINRNLSIAQTFV